MTHFALVGVFGAALLFVAYLCLTVPSVKSIALFAYNCFLKPISKNGTSQQVQLESFYKGQAKIYDSTRNHLLQGRDLVLQLSSSHLKNQNAIWVDVSSWVFVTPFPN